MTPKHGGAAATVWAAWRGLPATAAAPVVTSSQHAVVSATFPDAMAEKISIPEQPFSKVHVDLVGPWPTARTATSSL